MCHDVIKMRRKCIFRFGQIFSANIDIWSFVCFDAWFMTWKSKYEAALYGNSMTKRNNLLETDIVFLSIESFREVGSSISNTILYWISLLKEGFKIRSSKNNFNWILQDYLTFLMIWSQSANDFLGLIYKTFFCFSPKVCFLISSLQSVTDPIFHVWPFFLHSWPQVVSSI